ncbi:MAG: hypothetical protein VCC00_01315 [Deltaproteobacteria bacterium]
MMKSLRLFAVLLSLVAAACLGACSGSSGPADPAAQPPAPTAEPAPEPTPAPIPAPEDPACEVDFENTYDAIQDVLWDGMSCSNDACHGSAAAGGLDLSAGASHANLVDRPSSGSLFDLVMPGDPLKSYLYLKLAAKTAPEKMAGLTIAGSAMPLGDAMLTEGQLDVVRLWIEKGAPAIGSVGDNATGNSALVSAKLGVCLPPADPVRAVALAAPAADEGVQLVMPQHFIAAGTEVEICYASYYDFRGQIPAEYLDETGEYFFANKEVRREDANTHHLIVMKPTTPLELINDASYGEWVCAGGASDGEGCDPLDTSGCGEGLCRSAIRNATACFGFGPAEGRPNGALNFNETFFIPDTSVDGFFVKVPVRGLVYWNSHAFNLTGEDTMHRAWRNYFFADERKVSMWQWHNFSHIGAGAGTAPFTKQTVCREHTFNQGDGLLMLTSHTHKRGELFWVNDPDGNRFYESHFYDDPFYMTFDEPWVFDSDDPAQRTLEYCAVYNNGVAADGSPDPQTVTRLSRKPARSNCEPTHCAEGQIGEPCGGRNDHATCDSSPGAGDGFCDACAISGGITTDDEMFVLIGGLAVDEAP